MKLQSKNHIFSEQPFYGNYSKFDSHANTVISHALACSSRWRRKPGQGLLLFYYASTVIQCISLAGFRWPGWKRIAAGKNWVNFAFSSYLTSVESKNAHKAINVFLFYRTIRYLSLRVPAKYVKRWLENTWFLFQLFLPKTWNTPWNSPFKLLDALKQFDWVLLELFELKKKCSKLIGRHRWTR